MPARARNLFGSIASFSALRAAALRAAKGKRSKPGVAAFLANLEKEVLRLERVLRSGSYRPGRYTVIEVFDPKHPAGTGGLKGSPGVQTSVQGWS